MTIRTIRNLVDADILEGEILAAAGAAVERFPAQFEGLEPLQQLARMKFWRVGRHPVESRDLNFIEQINQTFTFLASVGAVRWLLNKHPNSAPFVLNLGTRSGIDIVSTRGDVEAETFAAVRPSNNGKLKKDIAKLAHRKTKHRYVFYICPGLSPNKYRDGEVTVVSLGCEYAV